MLFIRSQKVRRGFIKIVVPCEVKSILVITYLLRKSFKKRLTALLFKEVKRVKWLLAVLVLLPLVEAKVLVYPPAFGESAIDWRERISFPHIYPGQTIVSTDRFLEEPMRPGTSTVRWTSEGAYSINLDRIHLMRKDYVLIIKSKKGPDIRMLPFETTKIYLAPDYYSIRYDRETYTVWLARYAD
jgi:hypothetical protein